MPRPRGSGGSVRGGTSGAANRGHPESHSSDPSCAVCRMPCPPAFRRCRARTRVLAPTPAARRFGRTIRCCGRMGSGRFHLLRPASPRCSANFSGLLSNGLSGRHGRARILLRGLRRQSSQALGAALWHRPNPRSADASVRVGKQVAGKTRPGTAAIAGPAGGPGPALDNFEQVPGGRTPFGYKDGISFPQIRGNVSKSDRESGRTDRGRRVRAGVPGRRGPHGPGADTGCPWAQRDVSRISQAALACRRLPAIPA